MTSFMCNHCGKQHREQAFISHARRDEQVVQHIAHACCRGGAFPFLFERERPPPNGLAPEEPIADKVATEIIRSRVQFVLLGPEVSKKFWTQAWIGYEIGVSRGADRAVGKLKQEEYFAKRIVVIEDTPQAVEVCVPYLHALLLFDYSNPTRWQEFEDLVRFLADTTPTSLEFYKAGNRWRSRLLTTRSKVHCSNLNCGSAPYDVWVFKEDAGSFTSPSSGEDNRKAIATIKCPSCSTEISIELRPAL